ncbi:MAG: hypothetical protein O3B87_05810, partial [bacterium]|nr:hypothetical protein [bacterium]
NIFLLLFLESILRVLLLFWDYSSVLCIEFVLVRLAIGLFGYSICELIVFVSGYDLRSGSGIGSRVFRLVCFSLY